MKKKQSKKDILRQWGLPEKFQWSNLRYKNPFQKGVLWFFTSLYVRQRDVKKYGRCISCDRPITVETADGGHFCPASSCGRDLLFDLYNVNAECRRCNAWDEGHLLGYERGLIKRYGVEKVEELKRRYFEYKSGPPLKDFTGEQYSKMIRDLPSYNDRVSCSDEYKLPAVRKGNKKK